MDESYVTEVNYTEFMQKYRSRRFTKNNGFPIMPLVIEIGTSDKEKNIDISLMKGFKEYGSRELINYLEKAGEYFKRLSNFPLEWIVTSKDQAIPVNEDKGFISSIFSQTFARYGITNGFLDLSLIGIPRFNDDLGMIDPIFNLDSFRNLMANYPIFSDKELIASANIIQGYLRLDKESIKNDLFKAYPSKKIGNWDI